jgi:hypothetical protein
VLTEDFGRFAEIAYPIADSDTESEREDVTKNTVSEDTALERVREWFELDYDAKQAVADEFEQIELLKNDRHWEMTDSLGNALRTDQEMAGHPNVVENVAFPLIEGNKAEFAQDIEFVDYPKERTDDQAAKTMTEVKKHILDKNAFPIEYAKFIDHFAWKGTGIYGMSWDPEWKGGRGPNQWIGEVRIESTDPELIYPDHRCGSDIQDGRRIHKAVWKPLEYIRQYYPERGHLVLDQDKADAQGETSTNWELDLAQDETDQPGGMARLVETWYVGKPLFPSKDSQVDAATEAQDVAGDAAPDVAGDVAPDDLGGGIVETAGEANAQTPSDDEVGLHAVWWIADQNIYLAHRNFIYFDPEESPEFPFVFANCYPRKDSPWGYGEGHKLIPPQQALNKLSEIALEGAALQALGFTLATERAVSEEQRREIHLYGSIPGMWFFVDEPENVQHIRGQGVPASVLNDIVRRKQHMEAVIGRYDITQGKTPSGVTAFRALNLLAERGQVRLRPKESNIQSALIKVSQWIGRLVCLYWTEPRAYRVIGKDDGDIKYGKFSPAHIWKVWDRRTGDTLEKDRFELVEGMVEGKDYEFFWPDLDTRCTVTRAQSTDRYFYIELAQDMVGRKYFPPEVLFYAVEHGRLPPWDDIKEMVNQQFQQAQPQPMQARPPEAVPQEMTPEALIAMLPPEAQAQIAALPPAQQQQVLAEMMAQMQAAQGGQAAQVGGPVG